MAKRIFRFHDRGFNDQLNNKRLLKVGYLASVVEKSSDLLPEYDVHFEGLPVSPVYFYTNIRCSVNTEGSWTMSGFTTVELQAGNTGKGVYLASSCKARSYNSHSCVTTNFRTISQLQSNREKQNSTLF